MFFFRFTNFFCVYECFSCKDLCVSPVCLVPTEVRRHQKSSGTRVTDGCEIESNNFSQPLSHLSPTPPRLIFLRQGLFVASPGCPLVTPSYPPSSAGNPFASARSKGCCFHDRSIYSPVAAYYAAKNNLQLSMLLHPLPKCWEHRCTPSLASQERSYLSLPE